MANKTGFKGIDVRQSTDRLIFDALIQTSSGTLVTTGTTNLSLYELQNDGDILSYDFSNNTFTSGVLTNGTCTLIHRRGKGNTVDTGIWTSGLNTLTGFAQSGIYYAYVTNTLGSPPDQVRKFQFGSEQGDVIVHNTYGVKSDLHGYVGGNPSGLADMILSRNVSGVEMIMPEHCLGTLILATLEHSISGGTLTIKRVDGSTTLYTKTLTSDAAADPITGIS